MEHWTDEDTGLEYVSCDMLYVGYYGGAGAVGEANIRWAEANVEGCFIRFKAYYSRQAWLPDNKDNHDLVEGLERDYPLLDEETHSAVEVEWEAEAWESYGRDDLLGGLPDGLDEIAEGDLDEGDLWECYRAAMDATNSYPVMEYNGAALPINHIQEAFTEAVLTRLAELV